MKPQVKSSKSLKSHGIEQSVKFGIKSSGLHHILGILRNQLYSDKVLAVLREYSCNAVDAHVEAGCPERPIEVSLPNRMNPYFKVRDFGPALNESEIQDVYAFYGESTKRNSNNQIGMLGIGSKSAFAYGDNFVINSFIDGTKYIYNAFIDPSQIGQISKIGEESTDEENGIEIVIPTREEDVSEFESKAKDFFKWFEVRPIIHGVSKPDYSDREVLFSGKDWRWMDDPHQSHWGDQGSAVAVMGNIGYPIDENALNISYEDAETNLLTKNLVLDFEIGDLEIAASREGLQYTDFTRKALINKLKKVSKELTSQIGKEFSGSDTLFQAKCLWGTVFDMTSPLYRLRGVMKDCLKWNGKLVDGDKFDAYNDDIELYGFKKSYRSERYRIEERHVINCSKDVVVIENDQGHRRGVLSRVLNMILNEGKTPYLISWKDAAAKAKFVKDSGFDAPMVKLTSLEKRSLSEFGYTKSGGGTQSYGVDTKKNNSKAFTFDWGIGSYESKNSNYFQAASVDFDNDEGIFVVIDRFTIEGKDNAAHYRFRDMVDPAAMQTIKNWLEQMDIDLPVVHAVRIGNRAKVEGKSNWTNLWDWIAETVIQKIQDENLAQKYIDRVNAGLIREDKWLVNSKTTDLLVPLITSKDSIYLKAFQARKEMLHTMYKASIDSFIEINEELGLDMDVEVEPTYDIQKMFKDVREKYEMLPLIDEYKYSYRFDEDNAEVLANYINIIDVCDTSRNS